MPAAEPVAARPLVLVVDDAHALRLVMSRTLPDGGYDVLTAPDGQSPTVLLTGLRAPPDLVVTDLRMPAMGGVQLAAWLAEHHPQLPVMFVTGLSEDRVDLPGPVLAKPFAPGDLLAAVHAALERSPRSITH
jgi:two-component system, cell cycle sensor histidine kinase and response regulator CckA